MMSTILITVAFLSTWFAVIMLYWIIATKPPRHAIRNAVLFLAFAILEMVVFMLATHWLRGGPTTVASLLIVFGAATYFVASALNQI